MLPVSAGCSSYATRLNDFVKLCRNPPWESDEMCAASPDIYCPLIPLPAPSASASASPPHQPPQSVSSPAPSPPLPLLLPIPSPSPSKASATTPIESQRVPIASTASKRSPLVEPALLAWLGVALMSLGGAGFWLLARWSRAARLLYEEDADTPEHGDEAASSATAEAGANVEEARGSTRTKSKVKRPNSRNLEETTELTNAVES